MKNIYKLIMLSIFIVLIGSTQSCAPQGHPRTKAQWHKQHKKASKNRAQACKPVKVRFRRGK